MSKATNFDIIQGLIYRRKVNRYLEIGLDSGKNFFQLDVPIRIGVEPDINTQLLLNSACFREKPPASKFPYVWSTSRCPDCQRVRQTAANSVSCFPSRFLK